MALNDLLLSGEEKKVGVSEERIRAVMPILRKYIAYFREYPDMMIDFMQTGFKPDREKTFVFYFYQRVFVRVCVRYKYVFATFPRAYSKSMLAIMVLMTRCILFPGAKIFISSGGKQQSADIVKEKVQELCHMIPALDNELDRRPGKCRESKDYVLYTFKNSSFMDNLSASEKSRGKRRHGASIDPKLRLV